MPLSVIATTGLLLALAVGAGATGAWTFAAWLALAGAMPLHRSGRMLRWGSALSYGSFGWELLGLAPVAAGTRLEGPWGGPPLVFALALGASILRVAALRSDATQRWIHRDWSLPPAPRVPLTSAIENALRSPPESRDALVDEAVAALASAQADDVPAETNARRAFWINAYNLLSLHASRGRRSGNALDALEALRTVYPVAGRLLGLEVIEHGLLRGNARPPHALRRPLHPGDPLLAWSVPLDPRVHFALNCGARSCPSVRVYAGSSLDSQLELAQTVFVERETELDIGAGKLVTSRIFSWYAGDFAGRAGVLERIARVLGHAPAKLASLRLIYRPYDWTPPQ